MIESLTPEQTAKFPEYVNKWVSIGLNTDPCDMDKARTIIPKVYEAAGLTPPMFIIGPVDNPFEAAIVESILNSFAEKGVDFDDESDLNKKVNHELNKILVSGKIPKNISVLNQIYGNQEYWLSYYDYFQTECKVDLEGKIDPLIELSKVCGWWTPLKDVAIVQHRSKAIHRDAENRIHNLDGPAIEYRGSEYSNVYAVHGVRVSKKVIDRAFTWQDIDAETNAEVRRVMIELYGKEKYIVDSGAEEIHRDDYGILYRKELRDDEPLMMVKVVNSTVEPDGTYKDYWLRVQPSCYGGIKTARAAVASTWRKPDGSLVFAKPEDYDPEIES